jgi:ribosomal protein S18 acetylase RimI-like enzyme
MSRSQSGEIPAPGGFRAVTRPIDRQGGSCYGRRMIRKALAADVPRIWEIRFAVKENRLSTPGLVTDADVQRCLDDGEMWVWDEDGHIKGFSASDSRDGSIWALFIDPACEGQGIGQALLAEACARLRTAGYRVMTLSTGPGTRAERFYRRNGWEARGLSAKGEVIFRKPA